MQIAIVLYVVERKIETMEFTEIRDRLARNFAEMTKECG